LLKAASMSVPGTQHPYEDRVLVDLERGLFAVADGVTISSQGSGGTAADLALGLLQRHYAGSLAPAIMKVHEALLARRAEDSSVGETTLTAVAIDLCTLQAANVGDSPAFLIRNGDMRPLAPQDRSPQGGITQVIGYPDFVDVHFTSLALEEGDLVVVASDGVAHVLIPSLIHTLMAGQDVSRMAEAVVAAAEARDSAYVDDKSVIVLRFQR
jgi:serine/threonine protein phosphatase PrpC